MFVSLAELRSLFTCKLITTILYFLYRSIFSHRSHYGNYRTGGAFDVITCRATNTCIYMYIDRECYCVTYLLICCYTGDLECKIEQLIFRYVSLTSLVAQVSVCSCHLSTRCILYNLHVCICTHIVHVHVCRVSCDWHSGKSKSLFQLPQVPNFNSPHQ